MKRILAILTLLACIVLASNAQDYFIPLGNKKSEAEVLQNSMSNLNMLFTLEGIYGKEILSTKGEGFTELYFGKGYSSGELGSPKLPAFKKLIQIPHGATVKLNVSGYTEQEFSLSEYGIERKVYPVQPSLRKDQDIESEPFHYNEKVYSLDQYRDKPLAHIEVLGTMRGVRIARVEVYPINYNPVSGTINVYNDIEVELSFEGANRGLEQEIYAKTRSPYFDPVYDMLANSYSKDSFDNHPDLVNYPVRMLIVSHRMFEPTLAPFIAWKTKKGFSVEVAYTDEIGTTSNAIKTYIHGKYNDATPDNPAPSFVVLVGDVEQVPSSGTGSSSGKQTDLYYASVDGDYFPEMYYGRLSAQNIAQLQNIINKILYYEQYQFDDPTYLNNATLIAGSDGHWNPKLGQPAVKYATANYYNSDHGFNSVWGYGIASDPNNPNNSSGYTGCYDNERISVGLINYTAHCNTTIWGDPQLTISNVNAMTNINKYPLAIGNCCLAADFGYGECIGEAWIRAANKGAVTYIGSSPSSYWFEDFYWVVGAFPLQGSNDGYVPTFDETTLGSWDAPFVSDYITTGGLIFVGNLAVTEVDLQNYPSHSSPLYYWQAYNVLGDPSLVPFLTEGEENTVTHMPILPIGLDTYTVNALPGSYVAISKDGVLHGAGLVDETGEVEVSIEPVLDGGDVDIVVTRPQTVPFIVQVPAAALEGPYIVLDTYTVND
ncbi:MAG: C25 family cysteine peptidase, partial [Bacteroidales bacterium]|nr:C25 family cysteine peptidase [Bacteroidales bacterium]